MKEKGKKKEGKKKGKRKKKTKVSFPYLILEKSGFFLLFKPEFFHDRISDLLGVVRIELVTVRLSEFILRKI